MNWNSTEQDPFTDEFIDIEDGKASINQHRFSALSEQMSQEPNMVSTGVYIEKLQRASNELLLPPAQALARAPIRQDSAARALLNRIQHISTPAGEKPFRRFTLQVSRKQIW